MTTLFSPTRAGALVGLLALFVMWGAGCSEEQAPQPNDPCDGLEDCVEGGDLVCNDGVCARIRCAQNVDCPVDSVCLDPFCGPPQCNADEECDADAICWRGLCVADGCTGREQCPSGQVCLGAPPLCTSPPERCSEDRECPSGTGCALPEGQCLDACDTDTDCSAQTQCLRGLCRPPCNGDRDCPAGQTCHESRCQDLPDCSDEPECSGLRPYRDPQTCSCAMCLATDDCDRSQLEVCTPAGECLHCAEPATSEEQCTSLGLVYADGCCTQCRSDEDCDSSQGSYCDRGRCVERAPAECIAQSDCADGLACDFGRCVEPPSLSSCRTQSDCPAGEACYADERCHAEADICNGCAAESRCVAEPGDAAGTCAGCTQACAAAPCPDGQVCFIAEDAAEGYCVERHTAPSCES